MKNPDTFSWPRAAVHAALIMVAVALLTAILAGFQLIPDSEEAATRVGSKLLLITGFGALASYGLQKRRPIVLGLAGLLIVGTVYVALAGVRDEVVPLSDSEQRQPLRSAGRLCQQSLGLSLADPGPDFVLHPDLTRAANSRKGMEHTRTWIWENAKTGERLVLQVIRGAGSTPDGFRKLVGGMRSVMTRDAKVQAEEVRTEGGPPYTASVALRMKNGRALDVGCTTPSSTGRIAWTACATTVGPGHDALKKVRESLRFDGCGGA